MKKNVCITLAVLLILVVAVSLAASSLVTARPLNTAGMESHFFAIPGGSTHPDYDGDYINSDRTISLTEGWSTNLPYNTCAIAVRLGFKDDTFTHYASLQPSQGEGNAVKAVVQVPWVWVNDTGIVPIASATGAEMYLWLSSTGYVDIEISGYWCCDDYMRPTLAP